MYHNTGFTLIELLVVVLIIGILSAVALPQYEKAVLKSKLMEPMPWMRRLLQEKDIYYLANGSYPGQISDLGFEPNNIILKYWTLDERGGERRFQFSYKQNRQPQLIAYFGYPGIFCQVPSSYSDGRLERAVCKSFGSPKVTCVLEPGYDCYEIR